MDNAPKSKRLYPSHTLPELYLAVKQTHLSNAQRDRFNLAINQRDRLSADYVPVAVTPQIVP